ncbi:Aste57867_22904 [Aphanomyces stellatus]|uniref:Aste57867_22904 protein n=1 Tax=Aphanomyces stellatus TaxID=120398 RepID=A0A485LR03_9STRA|nr:hypothetical protein As57867_022833 [Aphanomyces stellatus]VFT99554.1 Aste57867_22904 [Aphanomyces stellatus]
MFLFASIGIPVADSPGFVERTLPTQVFFIWETEAGVPVAFTGHPPPVQLDDGIVYRIGPVFVSENERRRGYASALTAALSATVFAKDENMTTHVCLYTDASNPTSNKSYQTSASSCTANPSNMSLLKLIRLTSVVKSSEEVRRRWACIASRWTSITTNILEARYIHSSICLSHRGLLAKY